MPKMSLARRMIIHQSIFQKMLRQEPLTAREERVYLRDFRIINETASVLQIVGFPMQVIGFSSLLFPP